MPRRTPAGLGGRGRARAILTVALLVSAGCALGRRYAGTYQVPTQGDGRSEAIEVAHLLARKLGVRVAMAEEAAEDVFVILRSEEGPAAEPVTVVVEWVPSEPERYTVIVRSRDPGETPEVLRIRTSVEQVLRSRAGRWSYELAER